MAPLILLSLACGAATGWVAQARGRPPVPWAIWGTVFAPFVLPLVMLMRRR